MKHVILLMLLLPFSLGAASLADSLLTADNVYYYMFADARKAEAIMDALRERKRLPAWELDYTEGDLCYNTGHHYRALKFYARALNSDRAGQDDSLRLDLLHRMVSCYDMTHNEERKALYVQRLLREAEACGNRAMQSVALFNIGKSQYDQGEREEGCLHMEEAARMMAATDYKYRYDNLRYHYNTLLICYERDRRGADALRVLDALEQVVAASTGKERVDIEGLDEQERKKLIGHRVVVLNLLGRRAEADECYARFRALGKEGDPYEYIVTPYLFDRGMYADIFRISHRRERMLQAEGDTVNYYMTTIRKNLGQAYYETGNYEAAARNFELLAVLRDSLKRREQRSAALELAEAYENAEKDRRLAEQERHIEQQDRRFVGSVAGVLLLLLVVGLLVRNNRTVRRKNRLLADNIRTAFHYKEEAETLREQVKALQSALHAGENEEMPLHEAYIEGEPPSIYDDKDRLLFERMKEEIISRQLYLDPAFTREVLLARYGIPKNKLAGLFQRYVGKSGIHFFNELRLEYAAKLLLSGERLTMEEIARKCNIISSTTFFRLFSKKYGMTPSQFRKETKRKGRDFS